MRSGSPADFRGLRVTLAGSGPEIKSIEMELEDIRTKLRNAIILFSFPGLKLIFLWTFPRLLLRPPKTVVLFFCVCAFSTKIKTTV